jgi:hypothetical protein
MNSCIWRTYMLSFIILSNSAWSYPLVAVLCRLLVCTGTELAELLDWFKHRSKYFCIIIHVPGWSPPLNGCVIAQWHVQYRFVHIYPFIEPVVYTSSVYMCPHSWFTYVWWMILKLLDRSQIRLAHSIRKPVWSSLNKNMVTIRRLVSVLCDLTVLNADLTWGPDMTSR